MNRLPKCEVIFERTLIQGETKFNTDAHTTQDDHIYNCLLQCKINRCNVFMGNTHPKLLIHQAEIADNGDITFIFAIKLAS
jgi:protein involved in temperature-dependent protein secretion